VRATSYGFFGPFTAQFEAYRRLRDGGDQSVRVEHVHVHQGAQAVIRKRAPSKEWACAVARIRTMISTRPQREHQEPTRRPRHSYSAEVADLICERLAADGASVRQICQDTSMPARSALFGWLRRYPEFTRKYTFAKRFQIQWLADEMVV
jgi:hypothetical protein